ncbi:cadherin-like domain-containing protein [bacterium]|nr:cadherin-like domain-containing protein [bacterium]
MYLNQFRSFILVIYVFFVSLIYGQVISDVTQSENYTVQLSDTGYWDPRFLMPEYMLDGAAWAAAIDGDDIYVGGNFRRAGYILVNHVARWDGSQWHNLGGGVSSGVEAMAFHNGELYVAGMFTEAGGKSINRIAKWDGTEWNPLGSGVDGLVLVIISHENNVYIGGEFSSVSGILARNVAKWNGSSWETIGEGTDDVVFALAFDGTKLYAGGRIKNAGGQSANGIAVWDGNAWSSMGTLPDETIHVSTMASHQGNLYVGGCYHDGMGGQPSFAGIKDANLVMWDGSEWSSVEGDFSRSVQEIAFYGDILYVNDSKHILSFRENSIWNKMISGTNIGAVDAFAAGHNTLAVGGYINHNEIGINFGVWHKEAPAIIAADDAKATVADQIIKLWVLDNDISPGGTTFNILNVITTGIVGQVEFHQGDRFITYIPDPNFEGVDIFQYRIKDDKDNIATATVRITILPMLIDGGWIGLGAYNSPDESIFNICVHNEALYVGGRFDMAGSIDANHIARWDSHLFHKLAKGMTGDVLCIDSGKYGLYAAGTFLQAGNAVTNHIARWENNVWHSLGMGVNDNVYAMDVSSHGTYVGGAFTEAGGITASHIACWKDEQWHALDSGIDGNISTITVFEDKVYVGGHFQIAGGIEANNIALWDGMGWSALGNGIGEDGWQGELKTIYNSETGLYVGVSERDGEQILANGQSLKVTTIYRWDGQVWTELPGKFINGEDAPVIWTLLIDDGKLYVGGTFTNQPVQLQDGTTMEPEIDANGIAVWDGISWSSMGSGINGTVYDMMMWDNKLYAAGSFTRAGGLEAHNLCYWQFPLPGSAPIAVDDVFENICDSTITLKPLENDSDPDGENIVISQCLTSETQGSIIFQDSVTVIYTSPQGFTGEDHFDYIIADPLGRVDTARVTITMTALSSVEKSGRPRSFTLRQNYPNPFNPETTISFDLPVPCTLRLEIFDARGRLVRTLKNLDLTAGVYNCKWNALNDKGGQMPSGMYICRLKAGDFTAVRKLVLVR